GGDPQPETEPRDIPHLTHRPDIGDDRGGFELTREMGSFEPLRLFGLVLIADRLAATADDLANGDTSPDQLVTLPRHTYSASIDLLAESLNVPAEEARATARQLGYVFDDVYGSDGSDTT